MKLFIMIAILTPIFTLGIREIRHVLDGCFHQLADGFPFQFEDSK